jgi:methylglutaconyl-CoA hydratase
MVAGFREGKRVFEAIKRFPKPVIARVNGPALGGGVGLVSTTDIRIARADVYFALTEVKRGLVPAIISEYIIPDIGMLKASEYMLTGRRIHSQEALGSFLTAVVPDDTALDAKVKEYVEMLMTSAPGAMAEIKELVRIVGREGSEFAAQEIEKKFVRMMGSEEAAYGIMAFLKKEAPDWGRRAKL